MKSEQAKAADNQSAASSPEGADTTTSQPDLSDASVEQLDELFNKGKLTLQPAPAGSGQEAPKGEETPPKSEDTPPAAPPEVTPPGEEPAAQPKEGDEEEKPAEGEPPKGEEPPEPEPPQPKETKEPSERFRFSDPTDRAIAAVKKAREAAGTPITWAEAETLVRGE